MAQSGIHIAFGYSLKYFFSNKKIYFPSIILGSILPDIDILLFPIASISDKSKILIELFYKSFSHSIFTIFFIFLILSIISEIKKNTKLIIIRNGITIGLLLHVLLDSLLSFEGIQLLWPLPFSSFNLWYFIDIPNWLYNFLLSIEFFFFYYYAWFLISKHLNRPNKNSWIIKYLQYWKTFEIILFILFLLLTYLQLPNFLFLFSFAYLPSILIAIWVTYKSQISLEIDYSIK